jgi:hypothetical protein
LEEFELQMAGVVGDGVAKGYAVGSVPESHRVEKAFGIGVGKLQLPVLAGIRGVVDAGKISQAGRHQKGLVGVECDHGAEVQRFGAGDLAGSPCAPRVYGAKVGAVSAGGPCDLARDDAYTAKAFSSVGELNLRQLLRQGAGGDEEDQARCVFFHWLTLNWTSILAVQGYYNFAPSVFSSR